VLAFGSDAFYDAYTIACTLVRTVTEQGRRPLGRTSFFDE
jgi:hypothetical protein